MRVFRIDSNKTSLEWIKLDNGSYRAYITLGVAGLPLEYRDSKGNKYIETITEDDLFNEDSLKTAYGLPVTFDHPKLGEFKQNAEGLLVGSTLESFLRTDSALLMPSTITDKRAIALIDSILENNQDGKEQFYAEISPGYWASKVFNKDTGITEQKNRVYDHVAILPVGAGRGGQKIVLRTDSYISTRLENIETIETYESEYSKEIVTNNIITMTTRKVTYKGEDYDLPLAVADFVEDSLKKIPELQKNLDSSKGQVEALKIQIDSNKDRITLDEASKMVQESVQLWQVVEPIFKADSKDYQPDYSLSPTEIKKLYIAKFHPTINTDSASSDFINGVWSGIAPTITNKSESKKVDKVKAQLDSLINNTPESVINLNKDSDDINELEEVKKAHAERRQMIEANSKR